MLARVSRALLVASALIAAGCGVGNEGLGTAPGDGGSQSPPLTTPDAATSTANPPGEAGLEDASTRDDDARDDDALDDDANDMDSHVESGPTPVMTADSGPCANANGPCVLVPNGWSLVAFASTRSSVCPTGFDVAPSNDVVEGPNASAACSCGGCSVTSPPSCAAGAVAVSYDEKGTAGQGLCGLTAKPSPLANNPPGSCGTDIYAGDYVVYDADYAAPPLTGGACHTPGVASDNAITYASKDRACTPDSAQTANCAGNMCAPNLSGAYSACITAPGVVGCPPGPLGVQHLVGAAASLSCSDCGCTVTGTCSGTLTLFTDVGCTTGANPIATGSCKPITTLATYKAYEYKGGAPASVACAAASGATSTPEVALTDEATICCAQ